MHERALQEYFVRTVPLGLDRHNSQYWNFIGDENLLFVQRRVTPADNVATKLLPPPTLDNTNDNCLSHLYRSRPNRYIIFSAVQALNTDCPRAFAGTLSSGESILRQGNCGSFGTR